MLSAVCQPFFLRSTPVFLPEKHDEGVQGRPWLCSYDVKQDSLPIFPMTIAVPNHPPTRRVPLWYFRAFSNGTKSPPQETHSARGRALTATFNALSSRAWPAPIALLTQFLWHEHEHRHAKGRALPRRFRSHHFTSSPRPTRLRPVLRPNTHWQGLRPLTLINAFLLLAVCKRRASYFRILHDFEVGPALAPCLNYFKRMPLFQNFIQLIVSLSWRVMLSAMLVVAGSNRTSTGGPAHRIQPSGKSFRRTSAVSNSKNCIMTWNWTRSPLYWNI